MVLQHMICCFAALGSMGAVVDQQLAAAQAQRHQMLQARVGLQEQQAAVQKQAQQLHQAAQRVPAASLGLGVQAQPAAPPAVSAPINPAAPSATPPAAQSNPSAAMQS